MTATAAIDRVVIIGLGLIGSSLSHVMRREGLATHIAGHAKSRSTRDKAVELGLADSIHETARAAAEGADLVVLCIPVGACGAVAAEIAPALKEGAIVTDVGSVKGAAIAELRPNLPARVHFVPGHPVAGTEHSGPDSGFAESRHKPCRTRGNAGNRRRCEPAPADACGPAGAPHSARARRGACRAVVPPARYSKHRPGESARAHRREDRL